MDLGGSEEIATRAERIPALSREQTKPNANTNAMLSPLQVFSPGLFANRCLTRRSPDLQVPASSVSASDTGVDRPRPRGGPDASRSGRYGVNPALFAWELMVHCEEAAKSSSKDALRRGGNGLFCGAVVQWCGVGSAGERETIYEHLRW